MNDHNIDIWIMSVFEIEFNKNVITKHLENCIVDSYDILDTKSFVKDKYTDLMKYIIEGSAIPIGAFIDNKPVGFVWAYRVYTLSYVAIHIAYISVLKEFRGQGIAKSLIAFCSNHAKSLGIDRLELIVKADNKSAIELYNNTGFITERMILTKEV